MRPLESYKDQFSSYSQRFSHISLEVQQEALRRKRAAIKHRIMLSEETSLLLLQRYEANATLIVLAAINEMIQQSKES